MSGDQYPVTWPIVFTGRSGLVGGVEVLDKQGHSVAHTGDWVNLPGGFWTDGFIPSVRQRVALTRSGPACSPKAV